MLATKRIFKEMVFKDELLMFIISLVFEHVCKEMLQRKTCTLNVYLMSLVTSMFFSDE